MPAPAALLLARREVEQLLDPSSCIDAVEDAFRMVGIGGDARSTVLGLHAQGGGFHAKAAILTREPDGQGWFVAKLNANFPDNPVKNGLPTIQGVLALFDATLGTPVAVMDSIALTIARTAAASAVAARYLARPDASVAAIVGCGAQAMAQLAALCVVRPIRKVRAFDSNATAADNFAGAATDQLGIEVTAAKNIETAAQDSDIVITCTTSRQAFLFPGHLTRGAFVAAVGADNEDKWEISLDLLQNSAIIVDSLEQCATIGDLHHALDAGVLTRNDVRSDLASVVVNPVVGRRSNDEIVVFDSTGVAIEDVAVASMIYNRAVERGIGSRFAFGE